MIEILGTLVSLDLFKVFFCCDLERCHGICCVEGDAGAPVSMEEVGLLEEAYEAVHDELTPKAQERVDCDGVVYPDRDGELVTQIVDGKDCVFVKHDGGCAFCAIDSAYDFAEEQVSNNRPTVADTQGKDIRVYTSIGDSVQSGCGLEEYATYGQIVVANENIRGSAPVLVGRAIGADKVNQLHMPGARSTEIRYILDDEYDGDWITDGQSYYLSDGVLGKEHLDSWKEEYQNAVRESDVVVLDFGFNDFWVPWYGAMYDVAGDGRLPWDDMTPWERVERMGSFGALADTLASVGRAYIFNPTNWWIYDLKFADSILKFAVDYPVNCFAITDSIYDLNPDATLLICIGYNPMEGWDLVPAWDDNLVGDVLGVVFAAHDIAKIAAFLSYPGEAALVDMRHVDVITDNTMIFVFEKMTIDDTGFNPHPTVRGSEQVASQILKALGRGTPYATID